MINKEKKIFSFCLSIAILFACCYSGTFAEIADSNKKEVYGFAEGLGTETNPYLITNASELAYLSSSTNSSDDGDVYAGKYFEITNDIDLENNEWTPIGTADKRFSGILNGNGHVIKNLKISKRAKKIGFFGVTGEGVRVSN